MCAFKLVRLCAAILCKYASSDINIECSPKQVKYMRYQGIYGQLAVRMLKSSRLPRSQVWNYWTLNISRTCKFRYEVLLPELDGLRCFWSFETLRAFLLEDREGASLSPSVSSALLPRDSPGGPKVPAGRISKLSFTRRLAVLACRSPGPKVGSGFVGPLDGPFRYWSCGILNSAWSVARVGAAGLPSDRSGGAVAEKTD